MEWTRLRLNPFFLELGVGGVVRVGVVVRVGICGSVCVCVCQCQGENGTWACSVRGSGSLVGGTSIAGIYWTGKLMSKSHGCCCDTEFRDGNS